MKKLLLITLLLVGLKLQAQTQDSLRCLKDTIVPMTIAQSDNTLFLLLKIKADRLPIIKAGILMQRSAANIAGAMVCGFISSGISVITPTVETGLKPLFYAGIIGTGIASLALTISAIINMQKAGEYLQLYVAPGTAGVHFTF